MPHIAEDQLRKQVNQLLESIGWNQSLTTKQAAEDFYIIVQTMIESIVANQFSGGGKGPGPLPHRPPPPWPNNDGLVSRQEDYLNKMSGLLLNIANKPNEPLV